MSATIHHLKPEFTTERQRGKTFSHRAEAILFSQKHPIHWIHRLWEGCEAGKQAVGWLVVYWL